jgi:hypothetical protein
MPKMRLKHSRKGHVNPHHFGPSFVAREDQESVIRSIYKPKACLYQADAPGDGIERNLDWERQNKKTVLDKASDYPFPSVPEKGMYGRKNYEADLESIERLEQTISRGVANCQVDGFEALRAYRRCETMRGLCKALLMRTVAILQAKDVEDARQVHYTDVLTLKGIRLTPQQQEHVKQLISNPAYLKVQLAKLQEVKATRQATQSQTKKGANST